MLLELCLAWSRVVLLESFDAFLLLESCHVWWRLVIMEFTPYLVETGALIVLPCLVETGALGVLPFLVETVALGVLPRLVENIMLGRDWYLWSFPHTWWRLVIFLSCHAQCRLVLLEF